MKATDFDRVAWLGIRRARLEAAHNAADSFCRAFYWLTCPQLGTFDDVGLALTDFITAGLEAEAAAEFDQAMCFLDWKRAESQRRARNRRAVDGRL